MSITNWTSESMDWTSLANRRRHIKWLNALRLCLVERYAGAGLNSFASVVDPPAEQELYMKPLIGIFGSGVSYWMARWESLMTSAIGAYYNHHDEANWNGSASPPVLWTEATLMAHLGQTRILVTANSRLRAPWLQQQYDMLNQLRWANGRIPQNPWTGNQFTAPSQQSIACDIDYYYHADTGVWVLAGTSAAPKIASSLNAQHTLSPAITTPAPDPAPSDPFSNSYLRAVLKYDQDPADGFQFIA